MDTQTGLFAHKATNTAVWSHCQMNWNPYSNSKVHGQIMEFTIRIMFEYVVYLKILKTPALCLHDVMQHYIAALE